LIDVSRSLGLSKNIKTITPVFALQANQKGLLRASQQNNLFLQKNDCL